MAKEYVFEFKGEKEDFLKVLNSYPNNTAYCGDNFYYFNDYIVKITGGEIHFGVERGGHSGGYWYIPSITECDGRTIYCGVVKYIGPDDNRGKIKIAIDRIGDFLLFIFILPFVLVARLYVLFERILRIIFQRPKTKEKTTEEKLFDLMENHLGCFRKD